MHRKNVALKPPKESNDVISMTSDRMERLLYDQNDNIKITTIRTKDYSLKFKRSLQSRLKNKQSPRFKHFKNHYQSNPDKNRNINFTNLNDKIYYLKNCNYCCQLDHKSIDCKLKKGINKEKFVWIPKNALK